MNQDLRFGALPQANGRTLFRFWAPAKQTAELQIDGGESVRVEAGPGGWFETETAAPAGTRYRWRVPHDGDWMAVPDPASRAQHDDVHGWSVVVDPAAYAWQQDGWAGRPWHEAVVYELHPGLFGGFRGIEARLPELQALGVTAVELMPVADFPGPRNWGYDGVLPYAPDAAYGTPDELRHLVDSAHALGLMVMLDVVYNHFGPDGNYLGVFAPQFFRDDVHTPWGVAIDFRRPEVRAYFTGNAIHWINEYRFDGLRFDAVHAIRDGGWLDEMALAVRAAAPGRQVHLVLENDDNIAEHLSAPPQRFDAQWNDDAHHVMHVLLTGETEGYYRDYADKPAERMARVLSEGFAYQGEASVHREGVPRGTPSGHLPPTAFVNCLQNHDQIGNRAFGDRITTLADPQALKAAVALLLLSAPIPMIFMGEERGSRTPFYFFTSHNEELAVLVREGRRREFAGFSAFADEAARERIPDPNAVPTFEQSLPQDPPDAAEWQGLYQRLLRLRAELLMPRLDGARSAGAQAIGERAVVARWRLGDGAELVVASNLGPDPVAWDDAPEAEHLVWGEASLTRQLAGHCTLVYLVPGLPADLRGLADQAGVALQWTDYQGRAQAVDEATVRQVLQALGVPCDTPEAIAASRERLQAQARRPAMVTGRVGEPLMMPLPEGEAADGLRGVLTLESGETRSLMLAVLTPPSAQGPALMSIGPVNQPGYHRLAVTVGGRTHELDLAVAPRRAFEHAGQKLWGTAVQLYGLSPESSRTTSDAGIGDFSALAAFARAAGESGASAVAISPTHAGFAADPTQFSPYAPSSRLMLNALHIDPAAVAGADRAREVATGLGIDAELQELQARDFIDWPRAGVLKLRWLRALFDALPSTPATPTSDDVGRHGLFEALHAHFAPQGLHGWTDWPADFQDPASDAVARFAEEHADEVRFHAWLQQQAEAGLQQAQQAARAAGMRIGLIADLAVGMTGQGSHAWASREDVLVGLEVGAPPDLLNTRGQTWGLTAFSPAALQRSGYAGFIATLRAAMRHAGGVRIDHVLGLNRLWLVPRGASAVEGAYVRYPFDDLLNLIVLESHRHQAIVIGEDLGTVPPGLREKLAASGVLGMRVLWFEKQGDGFVPPAQWPANAAALTTTHDLPTAVGWWQGRDIEWRHRIGLVADLDAARAERAHEREALAALAHAEAIEVDGADLAIELVARTPAPLAIVPVEDLLGLSEQPNLPGTIDEHPNWRRRLPAPADRLLAEPPARDRVLRLTALRSVSA